MWQFPTNSVFLLNDDEEENEEAMDYQFLNLLFLWWTRLDGALRTTTR
jgi:hypothetical protein